MPEEKFTKKEANYKEPPFEGCGPARKQIRKLYPCKKCHHFIKPIACELVTGDIKEDANCVFWSKFGLRPNVLPKARKRLRNVLQKGEGV